MSNIVERLRHEMMPSAMSATRRAILEEAAAEIEALRDHVNALLLVATSHEPEALRQQAEIERLTEALQMIIDDTYDEWAKTIARRALEPKP